MTTIAVDTRERGTCENPAHPTAPHVEGFCGVPCDDWLPSDEAPRPAGPTSLDWARETALAHEPHGRKGYRCGWCAAKILAEALARG